MRVLAVLSEAELDDPSEHPCAMGGSVRDLLTHNIDHERMHVGQVYSARYSQRKMQKSEVDRLMVDTLRSRIDLIASLIGLPRRTNRDAVERGLTDREESTAQKLILQF